MVEEAGERQVNMSKVTLQSQSVVAETLLIALYARALEAQLHSPLVRDDRAVALVKQIDYTVGGDKKLVTLPRIRYR